MPSGDADALAPDSVDPAVGWQLLTDLRDAARNTSASVRMGARSSPRHFYLVAALSLAQLAAPTVLAYSAARLVRDLAEGKSVGRLVWPAVALVLTFLGARVIGELARTAASELGRRVNLHLQRLVVGAVLDVHCLDDLTDIDIATAVSASSENYSGYGTLGDSLSAVFSVLGVRLAGLAASGLIFAFSPAIAVAYLVAYFTIQGGLLLAFAVMVRADSASGAGHAEAQYLRSLAWNPKTARELRSLNAEDWLADRFDDRWARGSLASKPPAKPILAFGLSAALGVALISVPAIHRIAQAISSGTRVAAATAALAAIVTLMQVTHSSSDTTALFGSRGIRDVLETVRRLREGGLTVPPSDLDDSDARALPLLRAAGVTFAYGSTEVLRDFNLDVKDRERVAVVGKNGAGKTTAMQLLAGLRRPDAGAIVVNGRPLTSSENAARWSEEVALVDQAPLRLELSLRENVALWSDVSDETLNRIAEASGLNEVIAELENGWDADLSSLYEGGVDLSVGQWQRVALARAMVGVATGAKVLILDEPSSALDVASEALLLDTVFGSPLLRDVAIIIVTHRLSSVVRADKIVVIADGHLAEEGSHDELLHRKGVYADMFATQLTTVATSS